MYSDYLVPTYPMDAEKTKRIKQLEATVSRMKLVMSYLVPHGHPSAPTIHQTVPPPLPPKGLPPSSRVNNQPSSAAQLFTPRPPMHCPPLQAYTPRPPRHSPPQQPFSPPQFPLITPQPPKHPAPQSSTGRLPSSAIDKSTLSAVTSVVEANSDLLGKEGKMGTMAAILAREVFFGEEVMARCTAKGYGDRPALPIVELMALKEEIRKLYPNYWTNSVAFEEKWNKALKASVKRIRKKRSKKGGQQ